MVYIYNAQVQLNGAFLLTTLFMNTLNQFMKEYFLTGHYFKTNIRLEI